jgi:hypothetical protein
VKPQSYLPVGKQVAIPPSMTKFDSFHMRMEVCGVVRRLPMDLNRQLTTVLSALGIYEDIFETLQPQHIGKPLPACGKRTCRGDSDCSGNHGLLSVVHKRITCWMRASVLPNHRTVSARVTCVATTASVCCSRYGPEFALLSRRVCV